ncbi:MAG: hypothetical protein VXZ72_00145 [Chlamydiota bacterium]|nr:hypothetical protein [Chlamydiota bacterium]
MEILSNVVIALFQTIVALMFVKCIDYINGAPIGFVMIGVPVFLIAVDALWLRSGMRFALAIFSSLLITLIVLIYVWCLDQINGALFAHVLIGLPVFLVSLVVEHERN